MQTEKEILGEYIQEGYIDDYVIDCNISEVEAAMQEHAKQKSINFGRWLLKNADIFLDKDGLFEWGMYDDGGTVVAMTTEEIFGKYATKD